MGKLTPACRMLFYVLKYKHNYFSRRNKLDKDGAFYYDDRRLSEEMELSISTIRRRKRDLKDEGLINYEIGRNKGFATRYWILSKSVKKICFSGERKDGNFYLKGDIFPDKEYQKDTPNKVINKEIKKLEEILSTKDLRGEQKAAIELMGMEWVKNSFKTQGYDEDEINRFFEGLI